MATPDPKPRGKLWHSFDFLVFWFGDTMTQFTGQISDFALPIVAVITLNVTGFQVGLLNTLAFISFPTLGLFVGVWVDRMKRRPIMIAANLIQVAALGSVPVAYFLNVLSLYQLYLVSFVMGTTTVFYDVAYQSFLTSLVDREDVLEGNQKLQISASGAGVIGPSIASAFVGIFGAAVAVAADAIGTLAGALAIGAVRKPESQPAGGSASFFAQMKEGIKVVTGNKLLWTQAGCTGTSNLGTGIFGVAFVLYIYRTLHISPSIAGIIFTIGALGFLSGTLVSKRVTGWLGLGRTIAVSIAGTLGLLLVLLAKGNGLVDVLILGVASFVSGFGVPIYNINQVSLRQIITPNRLQGRMNATMRTIVWGTIPAGAFLGGIIITVLGTVPTMELGILVAGGAALWILLGPIVKLKKMPSPATD